MNNYRYSLIDTQTSQTTEEVLLSSTHEEIMTNILKVLCYRMAMSKLATLDYDSNIEINDVMTTITDEQVLSRFTISNIRIAEKCEGCLYELGGQEDHMECGGCLHQGCVDCQ